MACIAPGESCFGIQISVATLLSTSLHVLFFNISWLKVITRVPVLCAMGWFIHLLFFDRTTTTTAILVPAHCNSQNNSQLVTD